MIKIPAIRAHMGTWVYYSAVFSFSQISTHVRRIDDELHRSERLREQIQRTITDNYKSLRDYILKQDERFFNALVLAVYDGTPKWVEVELDYGNDERYYNMGFLEFDGKEKIFPVDGQHRVEGIKAALAENPNLATEEVAVLFIGHQKTDEGMRKSRRLFTSLNRYARPVKLNDIIALDEDDSAAIITRELLETFPLFFGKRINNSEQKAISEADKDAFTSLITLYQCNVELLKFYILRVVNEKPTPTYLLNYQKYRRPAEEIDGYLALTWHFWEKFVTIVDSMKGYMSSEFEPALVYRNNVNGGNLLFRPIGIVPFVKAVLELSTRLIVPVEEIFEGMNTIQLQLNTKPWLQVLWNDIEHTMSMGSGAIVKLLLMYMFEPKILNAAEYQKLKTSYAAAINYDASADPMLDRVLDEIPL
jgi:DNA sulfur modification protein DndB